MGNVTFHPTLHTFVGCIDQLPGEIFWAELVEILVFPSPTRYMLTSSGFPLLN